MILEAVTLAQILKPKEPLPQPKPVQTVQVVPKRTVNKKLTHAKKPITYKVKSGDTLTTISKARRVPVSRLWSANKQLHSPDIIRVGDRLKIPRPGDKLKKRAMIKVFGENLVKIKKPSHSGGFSSSGNSYEPGQCTWHVKNLAPWVGSWGDASSWSYNASRDGYTTHLTPVAGAVAWRSGHVAYVIKVTSFGVLISEMNYDYVPFHQREVVVPVSSYQYIY